MAGEKGRGDRVGPVTWSARKPHEARMSIGSGGFGLRGEFAGCFHRPHIQIKQSLVLVALILILLPQLEDLVEIFTSKPSAFASAKTSFFNSLNSCNSVSSCSIRSTKERIRPPGMLMSDMVPSLLNEDKTVTAKK